MALPFLNNIRREWRLAFRDRGMPLTLTIVGILTLLALLTGRLRTQQREELQRVLAQENSLQRQFLESEFHDDQMPVSPVMELTPGQVNRQIQLRMSARSPDLMRYTEGVWWTILPASPLAGLSAGACGNWPDHYHHGGSAVAKTLTRSVNPNPLLRAVGAFDMTLLAGAILPLAVVVLTYNVVAGDREQGRWSLVEIHAHSVPRLILARCVVRVSALALTVVVLTAGWILIVEINEFAVAPLRNFLVWTAWLGMYLAFWMVLAVAVNSLPLSPSAAGLVLLSCWTTLVIAVPSVVQRHVNANFQAVPQSELLAIEEDVQNDAEQHSEQCWSEFIRQHPAIALDADNPQQEFLLRDIAINRTIRSRVSVQLEQYYQRFEARESVLDQSQFLSPVLAWRSASDQSAGTSLRHFLEFANRTSGFHERYVRYFESFSISGRELSLGDIQEIPRFDADDVPTRLYWSPLLISAASLLCWTAAAGAFAWWSFRRRFLWQP